MTIYVVTYDLRKEETSEDYKTLIDEIERLGGHRYQKSAWLLNLSNTAKEAHDHFKKFVDENDRLWFSEFTSKHWYTAMTGTNDWIKRNPPER